MPKNGWIISGTDPNGEQWVVRADKGDTADHLGRMFRDAGYTNVMVEPVH